MSDLNKAIAHFKRVDPVLHRAAKLHGASVKPHTRKNRNQLFASLCEAVVSQQLSVKAADTIWLRLKAACKGAVTPESVRAVRLQKMRSCGLSAAKAKTIKELAKAVSGGLDLSALRSKTPEEATASLTRVWGIGPWTAEMFLMFGLGHPDIFSPGDLGLVRAMEALYKLERDAPREKLVEMAACWSPHRSAACKILWRSRDSA